MIEIKNPYFQSQLEKKVAQNAAALDAWLKTQVNKPVITIADLRVAFPGLAGDLSRELVNEVCAKLGLTITNPDDQEK